MVIQTIVSAKTFNFLDQCQGLVCSSSSDSGNMLASSWTPATQENVLLSGKPSTIQIVHYQSLNGHNLLIVLIVN